MFSKSKMVKTAKAKQWKMGGEEDKLLRKLIKNGKINKYTKPSTVQSEHPSIFGAFNAQVMRNHLNIAKRTNGLMLDDDGDSDDNYQTKQEEDDAIGTPRDTNTNFCTADTNTNFSTTDNGYKSLQLNYPVVVTQFVCPETENEKVLMAVTLPGGADNIKVELQDDGFWVFVKYSWPKTMFDARDLFKQQLDTGEFHDYHPMVAAFKNGLSQVRRRIDLAPRTDKSFYADQSTDCC